MRRSGNDKAPGGEIIGGNIDNSPFESVAWEERLEELGFTDEEIVEILASNELSQHLRNLAYKGEVRTKEQKANLYKVLKELTQKLREDAKNTGDKDEGDNK